MKKTLAIWMVQFFTMGIVIGGTTRGTKQCEGLRCDDQTEIKTMAETLDLLSFEMKSKVKMAMIYEETAHGVVENWDDVTVEMLEQAEDYFTRARSIYFYTQMEQTENVALAESVKRCSNAISKLKKKRLKRERRD